MKRNKASYHIASGQYGEMKQRMLNWARPFSILCFLDSNGYQMKPGRYECLLAAGAADTVKHDNGDALQSLKHWHDENEDWLFGHICYDYKNIFEPRLSSRHKAHYGFPLLYFFQPEVVCYIEVGGQELIIESLSRQPDEIYREIINAESNIQQALPRLNFAGRIEKDDYLNTIEALRQHIAEGDCYELNFCNEGYCEQAAVVPLQVFNALNRLSPAPFAAYYRHNDDYLMCASPERYIHKAGNMVTAQPIKGTAKRHPDAATDQASKNALYQSVKDRAENVMIVDLMRNDIARSCQTGTVKVDELYGIYSFPQVHQMISTVSGLLSSTTHFTDVLRHSFPMGSMTGAPKIKVMELIDRYESAARGLFSGTVGYVDPLENFDFNVVIRSLFYNTAMQYLSYQTGGAITYDSSAEGEWEEMRLKAWALERIFS